MPYQAPGPAAKEKLIFLIAKYDINSISKINFSFVVSENLALKE
jgi:hypothetical protein